MQASNIMIFAGLALKEHNLISAPIVQRFIKNHPSVDKAIPIEEISDALDLLRYAGFIEPYGDNNLYQQYTLTREKIEEKKE